MTNQLTDIQSQIKSFLQTNPKIEDVYSLIDVLKEYESECLRQAIITDLAWREQLPNTFPECPRNKKFTKKFQRIFDQLNKQGISVYYCPERSDKITEEWILTQGEKVGFLHWFRTEKKWKLHGFTFQNEEGNVLDEFADVRTR